MVHGVQEIRAHLEPLNHKTLLPAGQRFNSSAWHAASLKFKHKNHRLEGLQAFARAELADVLWLDAVPCVDVG
jgi:hypothetical protein